jgi:hypothetical protein
MKHIQMCQYSSCRYPDDLNQPEVFELEIFVLPFSSWIKLQMIGNAPASKSR